MNNSEKPNVEKSSSDPLKSSIQKLKELLSVPERWTKNAWGRDQQGGATGIMIATCWCLDGAISYVEPFQDDNSLYTTNRAKLRFQIAKLIDPTLQELKNPDCFDHRNEIQTWNDAPERTHADILELLNKLPS